MGAISIAVKHLLACGASNEAVVSAIEAMEIEQSADFMAECYRAVERERKSMSRQSGNSGMSGTKKKGPHTPKEKITPLDNPTGYLPPSAAEPLFDEFWQVYPLKVGKGAARKAFRHASSRASAAEIIAGAKRYAAVNIERKFTKHPTTWLNADCWLDEPAKVVEFRNPPKRTWAEIQAEKREQNADGLESGNH